MTDRSVDWIVRIIRDLSAESAQPSHDIYKQLTITQSCVCSGVARGVRSAPSGTLPGAANGRKFCTILKHPIDPNLTFYENRRKLRQKPVSAI